MHISDPLTYQFKSLGIIEKIQGLFVGHACLLCKQFDYSGIFALKKNGIGLHKLQWNGGDKLKILVYYMLRSDAKLLVRLLPSQLVKSLLTCIDTLKIKVNSVKHIVICNAPFYYVKVLMGRSFSASYDIVKPFAIVSREYFAVGISNILRKVKNIHDGRFASANESLVSCLFFKRSKVETNTKIQMQRRMANIRFGNDHIGSMEKPLAACKTPFLFMRSIRSSTMYSRENVCNTS